MIRLFLGGERSGKSALAQRAFLADAGPHLAVVTGKALDPGFRAQILAHRLARPAGLRVAEAGSDLPEVLVRGLEACRAVLVDSLDFWLYACRGREEERTAALLAVLDRAGDAAVTLVSCEVGLGPVAADAATRAFVRSLGGLNQALAGRADRAFLAVAGRALPLPQAE
ncbi:MAG: bifunctional adenosylcobinamide kinase/adenosylcobinamide-phosphate guanylyltransferase [Thermodesulfobacteriota bacterium]